MSLTSDLKQKFKQQRNAEQAQDQREIEVAWRALFTSLIRDEVGIANDQDRRNITDAIDTLECADLVEDAAQLLEQCARAAKKMVERTIQAAIFTRTRELHAQTAVDRKRFERFAEKVSRRLRKRSVMITSRADQPDLPDRAWLVDPKFAGLIADNNHSTLIPPDEGTAVAIESLVNERLAGLTSDVESNDIPRELLQLVDAFNVAHPDRRDYDDIGYGDRLKSGTVARELAIMEASRRELTRQKNRLEDSGLLDQSAGYVRESAVVRIKGVCQWINTELPLEYRQVDDAERNRLKITDPDMKRRFAFFADDKYHAFKTAIENKIAQVDQAIANIKSEIESATLERDRLRAIENGQTVNVVDEPVVDHPVEQPPKKQPSPEASVPSSLLSEGTSANDDTPKELPESFQDLEIPESIVMKLEESGFETPASLRAFFEMGAGEFQAITGLSQGAETKLRGLLGA